MRVHFSSIVSCWGKCFDAFFNMKHFVWKKSLPIRKLNWEREARKKFPGDSSEIIRRQIDFVHEKRMDDFNRFFSSWEEAIENHSQNIRRFQKWRRTIFNK